MTTTMAQALNAALRDAMTDDESVVVFGEDVGTLGGVFRITDGLARDLGEDRCFDTPLAESGIVGFALGMAMNGFRPVVEMQFDAFAYPAFEQLVSHVAEMRNRTRGAVGVPMVIRVPYAGGIGGVEHHSDSSEAYYVHTPGLKVVDAGHRARRVLPAARGDRRPRPGRVPGAQEALLVEGRGRPASGRLHRSARPRSAGRGTDATLVAYGPSVPVALEAAEAAMDERAGTSRSSTCARWCRSTTRRSPPPCAGPAAAWSSRRRPGFAGVGAEIAARVQERCFHSLHAPVLRVTGFDIPYPPPIVEQHHLPGVDRVLDAVGRLQWDDEPDRRAGLTEDLGADHRTARRRFRCPTSAKG